jgi:hypothetical protein
MPIQIKALHICFGSSGKNVFDMLGPVEKKIYGRYLRLRVVIHRGLNSELVASFAPYGILRDSLHANLGGTYTDARYVEWLGREGLLE